MARIVVALGGNAVLKKGQRKFKEELRTIKRTCSIIADLIEKGNKVVITHGNGPQVGDLLLQQNIAHVRVPLDVCGAETQSEIGYLLQQQLKNELAKRKIKKDVATLVTQVLVSKSDNAFKNPTKPIGPYYRSKERLKGRKYIKTKKGYRRVAASPKPLKIIEAKIVRKLVDSGVVLIAGGGGGIPVIQDDGQLKGVEAVIDKDLTAAMLAKLVHAKLLLILTDVNYVYLNYKSKGQKRLEKLNISQAKQYLREGQFATGSMKPKIEAAIRFVRSGGKKAIITSIKNTELAIKGRAGTIIKR
jgi:carbamate kinase